MLKLFRRKIDSRNPVVRKIQKFEKLIGEVLESGGSNPNDGIEEIDWQCSRLSFEDSHSLKEITLPESQYDRQLMAFAVFSHFFESGLFVTSPSQGDIRIVHGFLKGETFNLDIQPQWTLKNTPLARGEFSRLKSLNRLPAEIISELELDQRHSVFLVRTGVSEYMILATLLAELWLEDHIRSAQSHLNNWLELI